MPDSSNSETLRAAIGVDGGAGTLKFAVKNAAGEQTFYECGGANPALVGMQEFVSRLGQGVIDACARAGIISEEVGSAGFGLSGVDRPDEISLLSKTIRDRMLPNARVWVGNDALAALRAGAGELRGLVLIAGTGSICFASAGHGHMGRVGGWGGELGDEGSGFWIGQRGLQSACKMADGRLNKTEMLDRILGKFGLKSPEELIPWSSRLSREQFKTAAASLYPLLAELAAEGEHSSKQAILIGIAHLVQHALAGRKLLLRLEKEAVGFARTQLPSTAGENPEGSDTAETPPVKLVCAGGLFKGDAKFFDTFVLQLEKQSKGFECVRLTEPASLGALALGEEAPPA